MAESSTFFFFFFFHFPPPILPYLLLTLLLFLGFLCFKKNGGGGGGGVGRTLPPGSMGWPFVGETLKLFNQNPTTFFSLRQNRYGDIFKTRILGCPCVMVSNPEAIKEVMVKRAHLFKPTFPPSKEKLIGPGALNFHQGPYHARLKKVVQSTFLPCSIRGLVSEIEDHVLQILPTWQNTTINTHHEMKKFAFEVAMLAAFGADEDLERESIKELYRCVHDGYNSMPFNLPGSPFKKALKARKQLGQLLENVIERRRKEENKGRGGGLLAVLLRSNDPNIRQLTVSQIADNIFGVIFAAQDTTASVLTWLLKYLHDNKSLLDLLEMEQEAIRRDRIREKRGLVWEDTKRMPLTIRVIQETMRVASVVGFTYREAVEDVEVQGFFIPKGWKVLPLFVTVHHCAAFFPKPNTFDPSRFELPVRPYTFMPFGTGIHSCPGNELAKLEMLVLLHYLTTSLRWEVVCMEDGVEYNPFPIPKHGLPVKIALKKEMCHV